MILAVRPIIFASDAHQLVPTLLSQFATDLTPSELKQRLDCMWLLRRDLAGYIQDRILRGHVLWHYPKQILVELLQLLQMLTADLW